VKCCAAVIVATIEGKQVVKMTKFTKYRLYGQLKSGQEYESRWISHAMLSLINELEL